jgi:hypothetical protein
VQVAIEKGLASNPIVAEAVRSGKFKNGLDYYLSRDVSEGRLPAKNNRVRAAEQPNCAIPISCVRLKPR